MNIVERSFGNTPYQEVRCCNCGTIISLDLLDYANIKQKGFRDIVCPVCGKLILGKDKAQKVMTDGEPGNPFYDWYQAGKRWWSRLRESERVCYLCDYRDCENCKNRVRIEKELREDMKKYERE